MAESKKSIFRPTRPRKYSGDVNNIICRSSWETKFCHWCDLNENIIQWGSEEFFIPYRAPDGKARRYFPDFIMKVKENTGKIKTYVIEVKPFKQTKPPKKRTMFLTGMVVPPNAQHGEHPCTLLMPKLFVKYYFRIGVS